MIDQVDARLKEWIGSVAGRIAVRLDVPGPTEREAGAGVGLYLLEMTGAPASHDSRRAERQIHLRYLLTAWGTTPEEGHRLLGELLFAALDRDDVEVDLAPVPAQTWHAFGLPPRPAFVLQVPLPREHAATIATQLVREPLVAHLVQSAALNGQVLGPGDVPLAAAVVELPSLHMRTKTDFQGRFFFPRVPVEPRKKVIRVQARGEVLSFTTESAPGAIEPVTIRFQLKEA